MGGDCPGPTPSFATAFFLFAGGSHGILVVAAAAAGKSRSPGGRRVEENGGLGSLAVERALLASGQRDLGRFGAREPRRIPRRPPSGGAPASGRPFGLTALLREVAIAGDGQRTQGRVWDSGGRGGRGRRTPPQGMMLWVGGTLPPDRPSRFRLWVTLTSSSGRERLRARLGFSSSRGCGAGPSPGLSVDSLESATVQPVWLDVVGLRIRASREKLFRMTSFTNL